MRVLHSTSLSTVCSAFEQTQQLNMFFLGGLVNTCHSPSDVDSYDAKNTWLFVSCTAATEPLAGALSFNERGLPADVLPLVRKSLVQARHACSSASCTPQRAPIFPQSVARTRQAPDSAEGRLLDLLPHNKGSHCLAPYICWSLNDLFMKMKAMYTPV